MTDQHDDSVIEQQDNEVIDRFDKDPIETEHVQNRRRPGRPARTDGAAFPADEIDHLLVHGEPGDKGLLRYPSYRELAERFGVAHSTIAGFAQHHNCLGRREKVREHVVAVSDMKLAEIRADQVVLTNADVVKIVDGYISKFYEALCEGRVRCDSPSDLNQLARLKALLQGGADSRQEQVNGIPTLEELQRRHKEMLERMAGWTPEMLGYTPPRSETEDDAGDALDGADGGNGDGSEQGELN